MVTKFTLTSGGIETALDSQSLKNWGDVMCSYSRSDYGGIVRKFTSAFEFTLDAYDYLMALYLEKGFKAECVLAIYTINDDWSFTKQFECPLDFSTIKWTDTVLSISSVDNSLAALIKANKSTKYELEVGTDIVADGTFHFDRLLMQESATYEFTQGESNEENGSIRVTVDADEEIV